MTAVNRIDFETLWRSNGAGGEERDGELVTVYTPSGVYRWRRGENEGNPSRLYRAWQYARSPEECEELLQAWIAGGGALGFLLEEMGINV